MEISERNSTLDTINNILKNTNLMPRRFWTAFHVIDEDLKAISFKIFWIWDGFKIAYNIATKYLRNLTNSKRLIENRFGWK